MNAAASRLLSLLLLAGLLLAGGCATEQPVDLEAVRAYPPAYESKNPETTRTEEVFRSEADGKELGFVAHRGKGRRAIVYLHGISSHAGWFDHAADLLCARGYDVFCLDRRGSGINRENRGFASGDVASAKVLFEDIHTFMKPLRDRYEEVFLCGLSWGGKLATGHALEHPEDMDGMILITPGLRAGVDAGFWTKVRGFFASVFQPRALLPIPIEPEMFTKTPRFLEWIRGDPLRLRAASTRFFLMSADLEEEIDRRIGELEVPVLVFLAGRDVIVDNEGVKALLRQADGAEVDIITYEDQTHSIQFDAPERLVEDIDRWIRSVVQAGSSRQDRSP